MARMVSIRHAATDRAHRAASARLITHARRPWEDWREDAPVADLLQIVGSHLNVLRSGIGPALAAFLNTRDPARGLACVYLVQALVAAELEAARAERMPTARAQEVAECT